jgi:hypothetical protein
MIFAFRNAGADRFRSLRSGWRKQTQGVRGGRIGPAAIGSRCWNYGSSLREMLVKRGEAMLIVDARRTALALPAYWTLACSDGGRLLEQGRHLT